MSGAGRLLEPQVGQIGGSLANATRLGRETEQNGPMVTSAPSIEQRIDAMAKRIRQAIPGSEVRLFGSRARGSAGPDSDIDLLITAPDDWMQGHHRFQVLVDL